MPDRVLECASRRAHLRAVAMLAMLGASSWSRAQMRDKRPLIGFLHAASQKSVGYRLEAFVAELGGLGWKVGSNVSIDVRWGENQPDRLAGLARELVALAPAVVIAAPTAAARAVARASATMPIVVVGGSPVEAGLAKSLAHPGGMVTGVLTNAEVDSKYLELLQQAIPSIQRAGFLVESSTGATARASREVPSQRAIYAVARNPDEIRGAFDTLAAQGAQAVVILPSTWFTGERGRIIAFANERRWPIIASTSDWTSEGALMSYGVDQAAVFRRAAHHADRILKGTRPGDIPIERPLQYQLIVNRRAAKTLGLALSQAIVLRADQVIE